MFNLFDIFGSGGFRTSTVSTATEEKIKKDWEYIDTLLKGGAPSQLRQALITADRTLDTALKDFVKGETMGERLKAVSGRFDSLMYNKIWQAHKLRNNLVHESAFDPPHFMLTENVSIFKDALKHLGLRI